MICQVCAEPIPDARLRALPGATRCIRHAGGTYTRPASPSFPGGLYNLLAEATEAPILREQEPERKAIERAQESMYRQIEYLEEI